MAARLSVDLVSEYGERLQFALEAQVRMNRGEIASTEGTEDFVQFVDKIDSQLCGKLIDAGMFTAEKGCPRSDTASDLAKAMVAVAAIHHDEFLYDHLGLERGENIGVLWSGRRTGSKRGEKRDVEYVLTHDQAERCGLMDQVNPVTVSEAYEFDPEARALYASDLGDNDIVYPVSQELKVTDKTKPVKGGTQAQGSGPQDRDHSFLEETDETMRALGINPKLTREVDNQEVRIKTVVDTAWKSNSIPPDYSAQARSFRNNYAPGGHNPLGADALRMGGEKYKDYEEAEEALRADPTNEDLRVVRDKKVADMKLYQSRMMLVAAVERAPKAQQEAYVLRQAALCANAEKNTLKTIVTLEDGEQITLRNNDMVNRATQMVANGEATIEHVPGTARWSVRSVDGLNTLMTWGVEQKKYTHNEGVQYSTPYWLKTLGKEFSSRSKPQRESSEKSNSTAALQEELLKNQRIILDLLTKSL